MAKNSESKIRANNKYNKEHTKPVHIRLNIKTDADIIAHLAAKDNVAGYIKTLIRADMAAGQPLIDQPDD